MGKNALVVWLPKCMNCIWISEKLLVLTKTILTEKKTILKTVVFISLLNLLWFLNKCNNVNFNYK